MESEDLAFWLSWCIEEYAAEMEKSNVDVARLFEKNGVLRYLSENAEILHTQGRNYILRDIGDFLDKSGEVR